MYKNILVPVDPAHGEVGTRILQIAGKLVDDGGMITVLTVVEPLPGYVANYISEDTLRSNREESKSQLEALLTAAGIKGTAMLREGSSITKILEIAEDIKADAIILGSHKPDFRDYLIGSTAARVVRHAQCTVIVERSKQISI